MLFSSPVFFAFFAFYFLCSRALPARLQIAFIILGSTIFYGWWKWEFVWLPYLLMAIAYFGTLWMTQAGQPATRKRRVIVVLAALFLPLLCFKYANFIYAGILGPFSGLEGRLLDLPLPLGVSFVTFTLTAYVVDIYRGKFALRRKPSTVLAYVLFFPHLIAGPILRPHELIPQLERLRKKRKLHATAAIAVFTVGLVKKLVFADQIGAAVDAAYHVEGTLSAPQALLALYGFSVQIYCDFSGYTDMAIGLAMLLGIRLPTNFARPYLSTSPIDFWKRWHITLSAWLRDYLYIPMGGGRCGRWKQFRNLMVTMLLGGLWHGANWTFVAWGGLHGLGIAATHMLRAQGRITLPRWLAALLTFHFVTAAWALFRAPTVAKALEVLSASFTGGWGNAGAFFTASSFPLLLLPIFFLLHPLDDQRHIKWAARHMRRDILWPLMIFLWIIAITLSQGSSAKFVYFDF